MKHWRTIFARLPLPMLALAASYGVYSFALLFVPQAVAMIQAAAFELTYIGLAVTLGLSGEQRKRATMISIGAVVASIVYNTLSGWFHRQPNLLSTASPIAWLCFAILHGAPLAWVAYLVADLLLHSGAQMMLQALPERLETTIDPAVDTEAAPASVAQLEAFDDSLLSAPLNGRREVLDTQATRYECPWCHSELASKQAKGSAARFGCDNVACPGRAKRKEVRVIK